MHALLSDSRNIRITQMTGRVTAKRLDPVDQLLLILPQRPKAAHWNAIPGGAKLMEAARKRDHGAVPAVQSRLSNKRQTLVVGGTLDASDSRFEQLSFARKLVAAATQEKGGCLAICVVGFAQDDEQRIVENLLAAVLAAGFAMPSYKSKAAPSGIRQVRLLGLAETIDTRRVEAESNGNNLARWLTTMPPNKLDAVNYAEIVRAIAKDRNWEYKRFGSKELEKKGAGAFLAVAQGNENDSASIVRLRYRPCSRKARADLSLVGKGIVFDTGGTNLKPFRSMLDMHADMQGSAVALGTLVAIADLELPLAVDCWLAITENRIGPAAYKSRDIVTAANGKTIQTIHTDAEGRMALADTLVFASREKPRLIIDYATLTGSCVDAITTRYSGIFTNRAALHPRLKRTGQHCGERVWPFPIGSEFLDELKSDVADLKQCTVKGLGDHIIAASFLAEFIEGDTPWVHVDLSSGENDGGLAHIPSKVTGFGVRYTMSLLLDDNILEQAL